ncbi:hypothetical protein [Aquisphaera insulae]|uniref:hypothetical protein n=1 Tax=Aquisphaera insulae TaxID=2712864 RepID=UPI0013ED1449|nr:hypothetical protein [Aquisphaera insulae]
MIRRPFRLTDAMILLAAVAAGLWVNRPDWAFALLRWRQPVDAHNAFVHLLDLVTPHLAIGTMAALAITMRPPRPSIRRLARKPGAAACMAALAALVVIACWLGITRATGRVVTFDDHATIPGHDGDWDFPGSAFSGRFLVLYGDRVGFAVAGAWLSLRLAGRWRAEPTWIDRLGRIMGWLWIGLAAVLWLRGYLL